jgi:hypothetical protein
MQFLRDLWLAMFMVFHILVVSFGLFMICMGVLPGKAFAQREPSQYQIDNLQKRVDGIEGLQLDHRLTVIETTLKEMQDSGWKPSITAIGMGLLVAERAVMAVRGRLKE